MRKILTAVLAAFGLLLLGTALPATAAETEYEDVKVSSFTQNVSSEGWAGWSCADGPPDWTIWEGYVPIDGWFEAELGPESVQFFGPFTDGMPLDANTAFALHNGDIFADYGESHQDVTIFVECGLPAEPEPEPTEEPTDEPDPDPVVNDCDAYADSGGWCEEGVADYNCPDIDDAHKPITVPDVTEDPFGLDGDNDGLGCELDDSDDGDDEDETPVPVPVEIPAGDTLPKTGAGLLLPVLGGLGLLTAGGGLLAWQRRKMASS